MKLVYLMNSKKKEIRGLEFLSYEISYKTELHKIMSYFELLTQKCL